MNKHPAQYSSYASAAHQRGAALLMAMIILSGLLLLGLPFLFSQTLSRAGAMSFRASQTSAAARDSAADLSLGMIDAATSVLADPDQRHSMFDMDLADIFQLEDSILRLDPDLPHTVHIDIRGMAAAAQWNDLSGSQAGDLRMGIALSDEGGKLDANALTPEEWQRLFTAMGINADARGAAAHRFAKGDLTPPEAQVLISLNELNRAFDGTPAPLSTQQLNLLRPYLTVHGLGQGREGLADVGTVIGVRKRIRLMVNPGITSATVNGNHQLRVTIAGQTQNYNRNLEVGEAWTTTYNPTFWVHNIDANPSAVVRLPDGNEVEAIVEVLNRRFSLQTDGYLASSILPRSVLLLETVDGQRFRFRVPLGAQSRDEDLHWLYDPADPVQSRVNAFTMAHSPPLHLAREVLPTVNVHHIPQLLREVVLPADDAVHGVDGLDFPLTSLLSNEQLDATTNRSLFRSMIPERFLVFDNESSERIAGYPIGLRSPGIFGAEVRATVGDGRDRPLTAHQLRQVVQGASTTAHSWKSQADWELLRRSGQASMLHSWPQAVERVTDSDPSEESGPDEFLRPATLPTLADYAADHGAPENIAINWHRRLHGTDTESYLGDQEPGTGVSSQERAALGSIEEILPDGIRVSGELAWRVDRSNQSPMQSQGTSNELSGFHWSFWIQPPESGLPDQSTLLEMRSPAAHAWPQVDGSPGSNDLQNILRLHWDAASQCLVLTLNGPSIERGHNRTRSDGFVHRVPEDDFGDHSLAVNEQSLGSDDDDAIDLAPAAPFHGVQHWYFLGRDLSPEQWHHLSIVVSHNRPGGQAIIVDGLVGREVSAMSGGTLLAGDHITLPTMALANDLPGPLLDDASGGGALAVGTIQLQSSPLHIHLQNLLGLDATQLFPARGTVLIGNEYISYTGVTENSLTGAYRSLRANTNTTGSNEIQRWPVLEDHPAGRLVMPGSYRWRPASSGGFFLGAATSVDAVPNGAPPAPDNPFPWRLWAPVSSLVTDHSAVPDNHVHPYPASNDPAHIFVVREHSTITIQDPDGSYQVTMEANDRLPLADMPDSLEDAWPVNGGIVAVVPAGSSSIGDGSIFFHYDRWAPGPGGGTLEGLQAYAYPGFTTPPTIQWDSTDPDGAPRVVLLSLQVPAPVEPHENITLAENFRQSGNEALFQLEDPVTGRIEWLRYDRTARVIDLDNEERWYFLSDHGWWAWNGHDEPQDRRMARGQQRTIFAGTYRDITGNETRLPAEALFPAGSRILPVQNNLGSSYWLATGDVVTIMPHVVDPTIAEQTPQQMVIRYAATDAYYSSSNLFGAYSDTKNEWFTFTERVPAAYSPGAIEFLMGNAWSGRDLSVLGTLNLTNGLMPRLDLMDGNRSLEPISTDPPMLFVGSGDTRRGGHNSVNLHIDGLMRGRQTGATAGSAGIGQIIGFYAADGSTLDLLPATLDGIGHIVRADIRSTYGSGISLVRIGGEVMALRPFNSSAERRTFFNTPENQSPPSGANYRVIIGRGLLGSEPEAHRITITERPQNNSTYTIGPSIIHLPFGPIRELQNNFTPSWSGVLNGIPSSPPPAWLITSPGGSTVEMMVAPNGRAVPWLRGLWGTAVVDWSVTANAMENAAIPTSTRHLMIGWYPRYPAGLPNTRPSHLDDEQWHRALRSRSFPWVGLAARKGQTRDAHMTLTSGSNDAWSIAGHWFRPGFRDAPLTTDPPQASPWGPIDGIELKVHWLDERSVSTFRELVAELNVIPPNLEEATLRIRAPMMILERSDAQ